MTLTLDNGPSKPSEPSLSLGDFRGQRYPNQFFDLAQQYMPPTIKELFRWCTFYYYNSPLIGSAMKKVSRYPITDLILEDDLDSNRNLWEEILVKDLKVKERLMEINLDYHVYGNAFVSVHLPFTRFLICRECGNRQPIGQWDWSFRGSDYNFAGKCTECGHNGQTDVKDVPYKDRHGIRIVRWNPENIHIKFNEYTGRYIYMYSVPSKLRNMIVRGDKDILEDLPLIVLEALKKRRMIRFNHDSIQHLKCPTLAEQDQGWGKPAIIHVLKDMFYLYTLRRAQEAIALEHIVPFDIIYPMPNAQQDPYIHTDLANWRVQLETIIKKHRRDPNFKAVIPVPVGFGRLGGDGKALLLSPELNYLTQTIVGGMGLPNELLFGGMSWTGSSVTLRMLENDFIQNRSQLLDFVIWLKNKVKVWLNLPDLKGIRMADFRMADDIQRNQQLIGLNAQGKVSDQTLLIELGYDYDQETKMMIEEAHVKGYLADIQAKSSARSQGEASLIQMNYQQKMQEIGQRAQVQAQEQLAAQGQAMPPGVEPSGGMESDLGQRQGASAQPPVQDQIDAKVQSWAQKLMQMDQSQAMLTLSEIKTRMPEIGNAIDKRLAEIRAGAAGGQGQQNPGTEASMAPLPERAAPRRSGAV